MSEELANEPITVANVKRHIEEDWQALQTWVATLSDAQLTQLTDAQGWTVKDHLAHLARWQENLLAMLHGQSRHEAMGVDAATWAAGADAINAVLQQRDRALPLADVRQLLQDSHDRVVTQLDTMTDEDIQRPHRDFQPGSGRDEPIWQWIVGNTFLHYREHQEWMAAIVAQAKRVYGK